MAGQGTPRSRARGRRLGRRPPPVAHRFPAAADPRIRHRAIRPQVFGLTAADLETLAEGDQVVLGDAGQERPTFP